MPTAPGRYSDAAWSAWGKSADFDGSSWMPLVQHLEDSADVAALVWRWLPLHTRTLIEAALPVSARDGRRLVQWLAGVHDIGKCSPPFAAKVPALADRMREHGLVLPRDSTDFAKAPHGLVGHLVLQRWLRVGTPHPRPIARHVVLTRWVMLGRCPCSTPPSPSPRHPWPAAPRPSPSPRR